MNALNFFLVVLNTTPALFTYRIKHLAQFFFSFGLFQGTAKPQNRGGKVEPK